MLRQPAQRTLMTDESTRKAKRELDVFRRFVSITALAIDPDSIRNRVPPAPDILCRHNTDGLVAFELVQLIDHGFASRCGNQSDIQDVLGSHYEQLEDERKAAFDQRYGNAMLYFRFKCKTTGAKVRGNIAAMFSELSDLPDAFEGIVATFKAKRVEEFLKSVSISRGAFNGPEFVVENIGGIGNSTIPAIKKKLTKTYTTEHPIELLGYLDDAAMLPLQLLIGRTEEFLNGLPDLGPFRRIWVVDLRNERLAIVCPAG